MTKDQVLVIIESLDVAFREMAQIKPSPRGKKNLKMDPAIHAGELAVRLLGARSTLVRWMNEQA